MSQTIAGQSGQSFQLSQPDRSSLSQPDFESRMRFGLSEVLHDRPELRDALPLAAMMDDAVRWCA
jgi:hypothetical protein